MHVLDCLVVHSALCGFASFLDISVLPHAQACSSSMAGTNFDMTAFGPLSDPIFAFVEQSAFGSFYVDHLLQVWSRLESCMETYQTPQAFFIVSSGQRYSSRRKKFSVELQSR